MKKLLFALAFLCCVPSYTNAAEVINFGCPAYLIGGKPNLAELKQKGVTSLVIDPSTGISASQAQSYGMQAIYYVNSFCQPDKFKCDGPKLSGSDVSGNYGEVIPQPESQFFYGNFSAQTQQVQKLGGTVIEIDNMDEYVRRGHTQAIRYLIEAAGKSGINVVMKNETAAPLVGLSNVVGAIAEPGSEGNGYRAAFTKAGKPNAGVLVINGGASDAYTSVSNVNYSGKGGTEYTTLTSCTSNGAGPRAPTPPTNYQITPPPSLLSQNPTQPLTSSLPRSLMPLAQPVMQQPSSPQIPQQTSSIQPQQYFSQSSPSAPSYGSYVNPGSPSPSPTPAPSIAESLLRLLRPEMSVETPRPTMRILVSSSSGALSPVIVSQTEEGRVIPTQPQPSSTFTSNDIAQNVPVRTTATETLSLILRDVEEMLRKILELFSRR